MSHAGSNPHLSAYFCSWSIYARQYSPALVPSCLSRVIYAFFALSGETGAVTLSDEWADTQWGEGGVGCLGLLKGSRLVGSIGGATKTEEFRAIVVSPSKRAEFIRTAVALSERFALRGLDLDFESPSNEAESEGYVSLLQELTRVYNGEISICLPATHEFGKWFDVRAMQSTVNLFQVMAYDFAGSWSDKTAHHSNLYGGQFSADQSIKYWISREIPHSKIILGMPLYGRSFAQTRGIDQPFVGVGPGDFEAGMYDMRSLPLPSSIEHEDLRAGSAYCHDPSTGTLVTYDTSNVAMMKCAYVKEYGLAGVMFWELSGDRRDGWSIIEACAKVLQPHWVSAPI